MVLTTRNDMQGNSDFGTCVGLPEAIRTLSEKEDIGKIFIIGGESVYGQSVRLPEVAELYVTRISGSHECDTFFPMGKAIGSGFAKFSTLPEFAPGLVVDHYNKYSREDYPFLFEGTHGIVQDTRDGTRVGADNV